MAETTFTEEEVNTLEIALRNAKGALAALNIVASTVPTVDSILPGRQGCIDSVEQALELIRSRRGE